MAFWLRPLLEKEKIKKEDPLFWAIYHRKGIYRIKNGKGLATISLRMWEAGSYSICCPIVANTKVKVNPGLDKELERCKKKVKKTRPARFRPWWTKKRRSFVLE